VFTDHKAVLAHVLDLLDLVRRHQPRELRRAAVAAEVAKVDARHGGPPCTRRGAAPAMTKKVHVDAGVSL